jgi:hypothetical protein
MASKLGRGHCAVCAHAEHTQIDLDIAGGASLRAVGLRFGISRSSISRHRLNHLNPALVTVAKKRQASAKSAGSFLDRVQALIARTEALVSAAEKAGNMSQTVAAIRELRATVELWGKATGELNERPVTVINVETTVEWLDLRTVFMQALEPFPEARRAVADRLRLHNAA